MASSVMLSSSSCFQAPAALAIRPRLHRGPCTIRKLHAPSSAAAPSAAEAQQEAVAEAVPAPEFSIDAPSAMMAAAPTPSTSYQQPAPAFGLPLPVLALGGAAAAAMLFKKIKNSG